MKKHDPLFVCDSCDNECNCHPAKELQLNGDKLICSNCADDLTEEEFNSLVKFVPEHETEITDARAEVEKLKVWLNENHAMDAMTIRNHARTIEKRDEDIKAKNKLIEQMRVILMAVRSTGHYGVECFDVSGQNWFDARDAALSAAERGE